MQEFNLFGIPYVGSDVCGFRGATNEELCLRWQQLGAFHSFFRNHNDIFNPPQDPPQWASVQKATKAANAFRYQYLPYLYSYVLVTHSDSTDSNHLSLHFHATIQGGTVVRPVFFEFPMDSQTHALSYQFMWGSAVMVIPVTSPVSVHRISICTMNKLQGVLSVNGYLPSSEEWYSIAGEVKNYGKKAQAGYITVPAPVDTPLPTFLRAGFTLPRQKPAMTTALSRANSLQLLVALSK